MASFEATTKALTILQGANPNFTVKEGMIETWAQLLYDIPDDAVLALAVEVARECPFPAVHEFVGRWEMLTDTIPSAADVWGRVYKAVCSGDLNALPSDPRFQDAPVKAGIAAVGGWRQLGHDTPPSEMGNASARFRTAYNEAAEKERREKRMSPQLKVIRQQVLATGNGIPKLGSGR